MTQNDSDSRTVTMGRVRGVHGVRGMLKVESYADPLEQLLDYQPWMVTASKRGSTAVTYEVESGQRHGRGLLVKLVGCDDRDAAQALVGCLIDVNYAQLPVAASDEYYWVDLEGLRVVTTDGVALGTVAYLFETGANDVLVVTQTASDAVTDEQGVRVQGEQQGGEGRRERMLPYISDVVKDVNIDQGTMTVDWDPEF